MRIAIGRLYFKNAVAQFQDTHIEGAAAQVIDQDGMVVGLVDAVGQGRRRRFVDDTQDIEARDLAGVFRGLALAVGEVGRHRNDSLRNRFAQILFGVGLQFLQDHGRNFFRRIFLVVDFHAVPCFAHMPLNGADRTGRVGNRLAFRHLADQTLAVLREADDGRSQAGAFRVGNNGGFATFHDGNYRVCSAQVNPNYFRHDVFLLDFPLMTGNISYPFAF